MARSPSKTPSPPASVPADEIPVDPRIGEEEESTLGDDGSLTTASITSTILEYRKLHGRTFQNFKSAEYWGPNDEQQNEGLDMNHHMLYLAFENKLFIAPITNPQKVIDVGTGTGIWAIDFADEFPSAEVIGTDLSPIQPAWVPPNCRFELDDASQIWAFPDNTFDYIHIRYMIGCFKDWTALYKECYRCLKPGGWIEHQDCSSLVQADDGSLPPDSIFKEWYEIFLKVSEKTGLDFDPISDNKFVKRMGDAGFTDVQTKFVKVPVGTWPADKRLKEIGQFNKTSLETGLEGFGLFMLTTIMGWEYAEVQVWLAKVRDALKNRSYHTYVTWASAYAQKPVTED